MNFYYRSLPEGKCEVICTRCFLTIGAAREIEDIRRMEAGHVCRARHSPHPVSKPLVIPAPRKRARFHFLWRAENAHHRALLKRNGLLLLAVAMVLYGLPTLLEYTALRHWDPWFAVILPGDVAGCACLSIVFRKVKQGVLLYCLMTAIEACVYWWRIAPVDAVLWFADLVPTLVVAGMVLRPGSGSVKLVPIR